MKEIKSPGVDGIPPKILKETIQQISMPLAHVFTTGGGSSFLIGKKLTSFLYSKRFKKQICKLSACEFNISKQNIEIWRVL